MGLFAGHPAAFHRDAVAAFAWQSPRLGQRTAFPSAARASLRWRPVVVASGARVLFHGWLDNAAELAATLELPANADAAQIYGVATERWGDDADRHCTGSYCSIVVDAGGDAMRLARSPITAPPLHYARTAGYAAAASVPRALLAAGVPEELNRDKLVQALLFDEAASAEGWYRAIFTVPLGTVVHLSRGGVRMQTWYDPRAIRVEPRSFEDALDGVRHLLDEAATRLLAHCQRPGLLISGGLDSPQAALALLDRMPEGSRLPTFTFLPALQWDRTESAAYYGDERPLVEAFAAMHPRIEPHFFTNDEIHFDHRLKDLFVAMGGAPGSISAFHAYHSTWAAAANQGCDMLVSADFGNQTFSQFACWAPAEYLRRGHWRQMVAALSSDPSDRRGLVRRFLSLAVLPHFPVEWRLKARRALSGGRLGSNVTAWTALNPELVAARHDPAAPRPDLSSLEGFWARDRDEYIDGWYGRADAGLSDLRQGFSQLHGIAHRDVTAYRPLVDFCLSLPTEIYNRDGDGRVLGRAMARGRLPEALIENRRDGLHGADWQQKIGARREELRAEIGNLREDPEMVALLDLDKIDALLDDWPEQSTYDFAIMGPRLAAITQGIINARFVRYTQGRNAA